MENLIYATERQRILPNPMQAKQNGCHVANTKAVVHTLYGRDMAVTIFFADHTAPATFLVITINNSFRFSIHHNLWFHADFKGP